MGNDVLIEYPKIYSFLIEKKARYKCAYGGRGAARSWSFARALLLKGLDEKHLILCCREIQKSITDSVHRLLQDQINMLHLDRFYEVQKNTIRGLNGTNFIFEGLSQNVTKIKSIEGIDIVWVEEAEKVSEDSWAILIPTVRKEGSEIWITFNPDQDSDPTYKRFVLTHPPNSIIIKTSWRDNNWFPDVLRKEMEYDYHVDPDRASWIWEGETRSHSDAQILHGKWTVESFDPYMESGNRKVVKPSWYGPYFGADWGFARDPTTLVRFWIELLDEGYNILIEHEAYGIGVDINDTPEMFDKVPDVRDSVIRADSARPETIHHMYNQGFNITAAPKWQGCKEDGITWMRGAEKIIIHPRCIHAIEEAKNWSYKIDKLTGDIRPEIEKGWDHIWDAVRYGATPMILHEIEDTEIYEDRVRISNI